MTHNVHEYLLCTFILTSDSNTSTFDDRRRILNMVQPSIEIRIFLKTFKALCRAKPMCDPTMDEVNSEFLINLHTAHWICVYLNETADGLSAKNAKKPVIL